jgi:hemerythrin-like domain-containing protein
MARSLQLEVCEARMQRRREMKTHVEVLWTDRFRRDHERHEHILENFEKELSRTGRPHRRAIPVGLLRHLVSFLEWDVERHFEAEEGSIYRMATRPRRRNPIVHSLALEHDEIRGEIHALRNLVASAISDEVTDDVLLPAFRALYHRLMNHMNKEGAVLFSMLEQARGGRTLRRASHSSPEPMQPPVH